MQVILCFWIGIIHIHENPVIDENCIFVNMSCSVLTAGFCYIWSENFLKLFK